MFTKPKSVQTWDSIWNNNGIKGLLNPFTAMSNQNRISLYDINIISSRQLLRIRENIKNRTISWSTTKFFKNHENCMADSKDNYLFFSSTFSSFFNCDGVFSHYRYTWTVKELYSQGNMYWPVPFPNFQFLRFPLIDNCRSTEKLHIKKKWFSWVKLTGKLLIQYLSV